MVDRYATNAFTNFANFESGVFGAGDAQTVNKTDNPEFLWPSKTLRNASTGNTQPIQRGYMRTLAEGYGSEFNSLAKKRLHFQFNPDSIVRSVSARNDIQLWMNQDPVQLMQPIPGDANFAFELLFNREEEVVTGTYSNNGQRVKSRKKANLPTNVSLTDRNSGASSVSTDPSAVTDIGVLSDLIVFDEIIGQGVNRQLIDRVVRNASAIAEQKNQAIKKATTDFEPYSYASASVTALDGGKIKQNKIQLNEKGSGYLSAPKVEVVGGGGTGAVIIAIIDGGGRVSELKVDNEGSGYTSVPVLKFTGGGGTGSKSSDSTSDTQDQEVEFNEADATAALTANFGNSAFLVSLPVRIVFSSLFMVEGYITSTTVTFNKFNPQMVPIQCAVGITMQALYIGFARKDTYLTKTLADALDKAEEILTNKPKVTDLQNTFKALGNKLFSKVSDPGRGFAGGLDPNETFGTGDRDKHVNDFLEGDFQSKFAVGFTASKELNEALKNNNNIEQITQNASLAIYYKGNSGTAPTPPLGAFLPPVDYLVFRASQTGSFNLTNLRRGGARGTTGDDTFFDTLRLLMTRDEDRLSSGGSNYWLDKSSTSKYYIELIVTFTILTTSKETINAAQYFKMTKTVNFTETWKTTDGTLVIDPTGTGGLRLTRI